MQHTTTPANKPCNIDDRYTGTSYPQSGVHAGRSVWQPNGIHCLLWPCPEKCIMLKPRSSTHQKSSAASRVAKAGCHNRAHTAENACAWRMHPCQGVGWLAACCCCRRSCPAPSVLAWCIGALIAHCLLHPQLLTLATMRTQSSTTRACTFGSHMSLKAMSSSQAEATRAVCLTVAMCSMFNSRYPAQPIVG